jgi:hypothetical protein
VIFSLTTSDLFVLAFDTDAASLRGLKGVGVLVEVSGPETVRQSVSDVQLGADAAVRLRIAGIDVLSKEQFLKAPGRPVLCLNVNALKVKTSGRYAYFIDISLKQNVYLERNPEIDGLQATTWSRKTAAVVSDLHDIQAKAMELVGDFIDAYISVSPKKGIDTGIRG